MKKNKMMRLASVLLVLCLLTTSVISGTFAKYTSSATASDTAKVALWDVEVNGDDVAGTTLKTLEINLFSTVNDTLNNAAETDIKANDGTLIAPGTTGEFELVIQNKSEVTAEYTVDFIVSDTDIPLEFKVGDGEWLSDITDTTEAVTLAMTDDANTTDVDETKSTITVQWRWAFETLADDDTSTAGDIVDTGLGVNPVEVTVTANILVEQVD